MDGLTVSNVDKFVDSGKTFKEIKSHKMDSAGTVGGGPSFSDSLSEAINKVDSLQKNANVQMQKLASGEQKNIPEVMIATEKADIAFKLMVQVRNKVINAYNEIMKMQV